MKLYADYIKEREDKDCVYNENTFIIYKVYDDIVSLIDIYSKPEIRGTTKTYGFLMKFLRKLKDDGIKIAYGYTDENTHNWKKSEKIMLQFGFKKLGKLNEDKTYNNYVLNLQEIL